MMKSRRYRRRLQRRHRRRYRRRRSRHLCRPTSRLSSHFSISPLFQFFPLESRIRSLETQLRLSFPQSLGKDIS